jgi:hypothetical protein
MSKAWLTKQNLTKILERYRSRDAPTCETIAKELGTSLENIAWTVRHHMPKAEYEVLKKLRYSRSKMGEKNPMLGKRGPETPNWIGIVEDGYGYLTCLINGKRIFVHRYMMAQALGLKELPEIFDVHHINNDTRDNRLDNFALVTKVGHRTIHWLQRPDATESLKLKKSSLWEAYQYTTSR